MISQQQHEVIQGPADHPRYGRSLTVRPTIKTSRANRFPTQAVVVTAAARRIITLSKDGDRIKALLVVGDEIDPTKHPEFVEISLNLRELMNKHFPKAKLVLVSDRPNLPGPRERHAVGYYDVPLLRLETGYQKTFGAVSGEPPTIFKGRVEALIGIETERLVLNADFMRGSVDNSTEKEVSAWIKHVAGIRPSRVQITTGVKSADGSKAITKTRIKQIAEQVTEKTGIPVDILEG